VEKLRHLLDNKNYQDTVGAYLSQELDTTLSDFLSATSPNDMFRIQGRFQVLKAIEQRISVTLETAEKRRERSVKKAIEKGEI